MNPIKLEEIRFYEVTLEELLIRLEVPFEESFIDSSVIVDDTKKVLRFNTKRIKKIG